MKQLVESLITAAIGGGLTAVGDYAHNALMGDGKIDWSHMGTVASVGALVAIAALWRQRPGTNQ